MHTGERFKIMLIWYHQCRTVTITHTRIGRKSYSLEVNIVLILPVYEECLFFKRCIVELDTNDHCGAVVQLLVDRAPNHQHSSYRDHTGDFFSSLCLRMTGSTIAVLGGPFPGLTRIM